MFGLKVVKKQDYLDVLEQKELYQRDATDKAVRISELEGEVKYLNGRISELEQQVQELYVEKAKEEKPVLLQDVAETPLTVEKPKRTRKVITTEKTTGRRRRVVHKSEETE